jgi:hypothetical protein
MIRNSFDEWRLERANEALTGHGLIHCYTDATEAQTAIARAIIAARSNILMVGMNFSTTPIFSYAALRRQIDHGVDLRFLILNPRSGLVPTFAGDFAMTATELYGENRQNLKSLNDLRLYSESVALSSGTSGTVDVRLYDAPPRMRCYIFDDTHGESFFVPYVNRTPPRPLPVLHCRGGMRLARCYREGVERLWSSSTTNIAKFLAENPDFLLD